MLDLLIRGGTVVTPGGAGAWEVGVEGERIVAVGLPGSLPVETARVIDATGKIVVPGGVEPHAHIGSPVLTAPQIQISGPAEVTAAAVFGGTTTVVDFAVQSPQGDIFAALEERKARWAGQSYADYSWHCTLTHGFDPAVVLPQIAGVVADGFPSFKIFTTSVRPPGGAHTNHVDYGRLAAVMERVEAAGGIMVVHSEDDEMVQYNYELARVEGRWDWHHMHEVHTNLSEEVSFRRVITLARRESAGLYLVHVSAAEGAEAVARARAEGQPVYGETLHNYLSFTAGNYREPDGMKYHTYPSLKSEMDRQRLWDGVLRGDLSTVATDHISTTYSQKTAGRTVADVTGGHNGIETRLGIVYTEGVGRRGMSLERFVDVTSANAARVLGFYPRKGAIAPGSDADIAIIDPTVKKRLSMADLHLVDYSIWEGWPLEGWPVTTILRGKVVVEDGKLLAQPGTGRLIPRKVDAAVLQRPVC